MFKSKNLLTFIILLTLTSCFSEPEEDKGATVDGKNPNYPLNDDDRRSLKRGKLTGDEGITLIGGRPSLGGRGMMGESIARGVNAYLWQAALDTISFMPIATVDATGGVIITDWYEDPNSKGEKIKANVVISSDELRASGVKVSLFRQVGGKSAPANPDVARKLEDKILTRARELKIDDERI